eukprot:m.313707 g.313707  ORF g.313707 m.313707 type:complete len:701 (+) comp16491_c9_seq13:52-2154(+)
MLWFTSFLLVAGTCVDSATLFSQPPVATLGGTIAYYSDPQCKTSPMDPPIDVTSYCNASINFPTGAAYSVIYCLHGATAQALCNATECTFTCFGPTSDACLASLANPTNPPLNSGCVLGPSGGCAPQQTVGGVMYASATCDAHGPAAPPVPKPAPFQPMEWTGATVKTYSDPFCEYSAGKDFNIVGNCTTVVPLPPTGTKPQYWQAGYLTGKEANIFCGDETCVVVCAAFTQENCNEVAQLPQGPFNASDLDGCKVLPIDTCAQIRKEYPGLPALYSRVHATNKPGPPISPPHPNPVPPMVFVGGLTSSNIEYKLDDAAPVPFTKCPTSTNGTWATLWPFDPTDQTGFVCSIANLQLTLSENGTQYVPKRKGLTTRVIDVGGFNGMPMFTGILQSYERAGWEINKTLFGLPYDWRIPTNSQNGPGQFFSNMKNIIEEAYAKNNNTKVVILAPSLGPQYVLGFLHRMTQAWKDTYIDWYLMVSPVNSGAPEALISYVSGAPFQQASNENKLAIISGEEFARAVPVLSWLFPRAGTDPYTYNSTEPLIITPTKNYTSANYIELFEDMHMNQETIESLKFNMQEPDLHDFAFPGVNTFITYGYNISTLSSAYYNESMGMFPSLPYKFGSVSGDGLVPERSSKRFFEWATAAKASNKSVLYKGYLNQPHAECIAAAGSGGSGECWMDAMGLILNRTTPSGAQRL